MSLTSLRLTQFRVQKLQCIGGEGGISPYRITTLRGRKLGIIGALPWHTQAAANRPAFRNGPARIRHLLISLSRRFDRAAG